MTYINLLQNLANPIKNYMNIERNKNKRVKNKRSTKLDKIYLIENIMPNYAIIVEN